MTTLPQAWLTGEAPIGKLYEARREDVRRRVRNLTGP
jgi:hypothetical protein